MTDERSGVLAFIMILWCDGGRRGQESLLAGAGF